MYDPASAVNLKNRSLHGFKSREAVRKNTSEKSLIQRISPCIPVVDDFTGGGHKRKRRVADKLSLGWREVVGWRAHV